jgi:hypothetical protein
MVILKQRFEDSWLLRFQRRGHRRPSKHGSIRLERQAGRIKSIDGGPFEQEVEKFAGLHNRVGGALVYFAAQSLSECFLELLMKQWR